MNKFVVALASLSLSYFLVSVVSAEGIESLSLGSDPNELPPRTDPVFSMIKDRFENDRDFGALASYARLNGNVIFGLFRKGVLAEYETGDGIRYIGHWPLTRWEGERNDSSVWQMYTMEGAPDQRNWERYGITRRISAEPPIGCLADSPLRYGDIEGNGDKDLVLFLPQHDRVLDWVVFSPKYEQISFAARLAQRDFVDPGDYGSPRYQYISQAYETVSNASGSRGYAKLYFGDFRSESEKHHEEAEETVHDIIAWRKYYRALEVDADREGFELRRQILRHYRLEDGAYVRLDTPEEVIRESLTARDLTWAKGFPNYSECEGEEGQLIPEMHDPLLNDPEVLEGVDPDTMTLIETEKD